MLMTKRALFDSGWRNQLRRVPKGAVLYFPGLVGGGSKIFDYSGNTTAIDVGNSATDRAESFAGASTLVDLANPANHSGHVSSVQIWAAANLTGLRVGTFYLVSGTTYACRDSATIGAVTAGAVRTFNNLDIHVETGDYLGCFFDTGTVEYVSTGGSGIRYKAGEIIDPGDSGDFTALEAAGAISLYATGFGATYGTIVGATWTRLSSGLWALSHDGTDDKVAITNVAGLRPTTALTVMAWVYPTTLTATVEYIIMSHLNDSAVNRRAWMFLIDGSGKFKLYCSSDGTHAASDNQASTTVAVINTWYHVAATYSPTALTIYINGVADGTKDPLVNSLYQNTTDNLFLGEDAGGGRDFAGRIALSKMFLETLTSAQIAQDYQQTRHLFGV